MFQLIVLLSILIVSYQVYNFILRRRRISNVNGKAVLVTGCDSGLGLEMAKHLHKIGFFVIGTCINKQSNGYKVLSSNGDRMCPKLLDLTKEDSINKAVDDIQSELKSSGFNGLYGLVNNAGVFFSAEFDWLTWPQIEKQINVNFSGSIRLTKIFLQDIISNQGRLVYVTSLISSVPFPLSSVYCATKSGLSMFAEGLEAELSRFGVKIVLMQPGDFTKMTEIVPTFVKASSVMWDSMIGQQKARYADYFSSYYHNAIAQRGIISYNSYEESSLYTDIEEALCSLNPRSVMAQSFLWYQILIRTISVLPRFLRIKISQLFQFCLRKNFKNK